MVNIILSDYQYEVNSKIVDIVDAIESTKDRTQNFKLLQIVLLCLWSLQQIAS